MATYTLGYHKGEQYINCNRCGLRSFNYKDINEKYCSYCGLYLYPNGVNGDISTKDSDLEKQLQDSINFVNKSKSEANEVVEDKPKVKKSRKVEINCKFCGKVVEVVSEYKLTGKLYRKYDCGHGEFLPLLDHPTDRDEKWNKFFPFQHEGIEFIEESNYTALLGDEMGLGKTIQALGAYRYNYTELSPCLMICEASKVYDWKDEFRQWVGDKFDEIRDEPVIHPSGTYGLCPGFRNHIISMSLLGKKKILESIKNYGFKLMIVDESHSFKNEDAERTFALQQISKVIPHKIFLSGTPIMNKVEEFFTTLNILRPSHFPSKANLIAKCDRTESGRVLGISSYYRDRFFKMTSEYVKRRTKKQVGIQLPKLNIHKQLCNINNNKDFVKAYNDQLDKLEEILNNMNEGLFGTTDILGIFAKLRHITGMAKVKSIIAYVHEFMESTDPEDKICVGVHHKLVMDFLAGGLAEYHPICISDEDGLTKANRIEAFKKPERRLLIASILGAGQGLNIQFCKNAIQAERQWNPAKEQQFYGRFHRIVKNSDGSLKTEFDDEKDAVIIDIINAKDTIDEYFDATVNLKKAIVDSTVDEELSVDYEFMMELAKKLVQSRLSLNIG